jgi:Tectonin domain
MNWQFHEPVPNRSIWPGVVAGLLLTIPIYGQSTVLNWTKIPGVGYDIGVAPSTAEPKATADNATVWVLGPPNSGEDRTVYSWDSLKWQQAPAGSLGKRIAVDSTNVPWVATDSGALLKWNFGPYKFEAALPSSSPLDVATGGDGSVWAIVGGSGVGVRRVAPTAAATPAFDSRTLGVPQKITVHPSGVPAFVTSSMTVYTLSGGTFGSWQLFPGTLQDISHGADGSLWGVGPGPDNALLSWDGSSWVKEGTTGVMAVSARNGMEVWIVKTNNEIWRGISSASQTFTSYTNAVNGITAKLGQMTDAGTAMTLAPDLVALTTTYKVLRPQVQTLFGTSLQSSQASVNAAERALNTKVNEMMGGALAPTVGYYLKGLK